MNKVFKNNGEFTKRAGEVVEEMVKSDGVYHGVRYSGRGRFITFLFTNEDYARKILEHFEIPFTSGNDAPRGGTCGRFLQFNVNDLKKALAQ